MSTIIVGSVDEGAKWWSQAAFYKIELARLYKQNNAFMSAWKFPTADVKIHVFMRNGQPVAFIYTGGGVQVCWQDDNTRTEFISPDGKRVVKDGYLVSDRSAASFNSYWVSSNFNTAISIGARTIYYKGAKYTMEPNNEVLYLKSAMFFRGKIIVAYIAQTTFDYTVAHVTLFAKTKFFVIGGTIINLSSDDPAIIYARFGGDNWLWTVSKDDLNHTPGNTNTYLKAFRVSSTEVGISVDLVAQTTVDCTERHVVTKSTTVITDPPGRSEYHYIPNPLGNIVGTASKVGTYTYYMLDEVNNQIGGIFVQGNKISIAFRTSIKANNFSTTSTLVGVIVDGSATGTVANAIYWDDELTTITATQSIDGTTDLSAIVYEINTNPLTDDPSLTQTEVFRYSVVSADYHGDPSAPFGNIGVATRHSIVWGYADGINEVYVVAHDHYISNAVSTLPPTLMNRHNAIVGKYGSWDLVSDSASATGLENIGYRDPLELNTTANSNFTNEFLSTQGRWGAFDGRTYLLQAFNPAFPYNERFALTLGADGQGVKIIHENPPVYNLPLIITLGAR
jgi:hypothetical protein